ncbi:kinesin-like protein KIF21B, partial [Engraulis encrasicolus]|uniref:kinesin-like protein KIF21B n=1 Tax=Engraulis encrasicolus TaxID=184585 RepID=UPI002FCF2395
PLMPSTLQYVLQPMTLQCTVPEKDKGLQKRAKLLGAEPDVYGRGQLQNRGGASRDRETNGLNGGLDSDDNDREEDGMYPLQEEESGCDEDDDEENDEEEEDEEAREEEEEFDSDESLVDSDSDSDEKVVSFQADLADLTCEIEIKQKLIDELENSQRRLLMLKLQYEEKLITLQNKIRDTQLERDRVLQNLMSMENYTEEKASRIRADYEKRLKEMNRD